MAHPSNRKPQLLKQETHGEAVEDDRQDVHEHTVSVITEGHAKTHHSSPAASHDHGKRAAKHMPHVLKHNKRLSQYSYQVPRVESKLLRRRQDVSIGVNASVSLNVTPITSAIDPSVTLIVGIGSSTNSSSVDTTTTYACNPAHSYPNSASCISTTGILTLVTPSPIAVITAPTIPVANTTSEGTATALAVSTTTLENLSSAITIGSSSTSTANSTTSDLQTTVLLTTSYILPVVSTSSTVNATDDTLLPVQTITVSPILASVTPVTVTPTISGSIAGATTTNSTSDATTISVIPIPISFQASTSLDSNVTSTAMPSVNPLSTALTGTVSTPTSILSVSENGTLSGSAPTSASLLSLVPVLGIYESSASASPTRTSGASGTANGPVSLASALNTPYVVGYSPVATITAASTEQTASTVPAAQSTPSLDSTTIYVIPVVASAGTSPIAYETASILAESLILSASSSPLPSSIPGSLATSMPPGAVSPMDASTYVTPVSTRTYSGIVTLGASSAFPIVLPVGSSGSGLSTTIYALLPSSPTTESLPVASPFLASSAATLPTGASSLLASGMPTTFATVRSSNGLPISTVLTVSTIPASISPNSGMSSTTSGVVIDRSSSPLPFASSSPFPFGSSSIVSSSTLPLASSPSSSPLASSAISASSSARSSSSGGTSFSFGGTASSSPTNTNVGSSTSASPTAGTIVAPDNSAAQAQMTRTIAGSVVGGVAGLALLSLLALLLLKFVKRRHIARALGTSNNAAPADAAGAGGAAGLIPAGGFLSRFGAASAGAAVPPATPPMGERGFQRLGGRKLASQFSPGMEGPSSLVPGASPTPAPSSFYPSGAPSNAGSFGTFGSPLVGAGAVAGAGTVGAAAAAKRSSRLPGVKEEEDPFADQNPFADPVWNNDTPVRGITSPLLGSNTGSPQRPGTRGSGFSRFKEDVN